MLYLEANVTHLPRTFSDHCLVIIELMGSRTCVTNKPFRFHTMWLLHPQFPKVVEDLSPWLSLILQLEWRSGIMKSLEICLQGQGGCLLG